MSLSLYECITLSFFGQVRSHHHYCQKAKNIHIQTNIKTSLNWCLTSSPTELDWTSNNQINYFLSFPSLRLLLNAVACITRWDGGSSLASKSAAPIFPLSPVNFFFLLNFTKKSELYYKPATGFTGGLVLQLLSWSRLGTLTAAHGWKVGAGNGPDVWGLEGELGGEVELLLLPLVVVGGHGGSHRVRGGAPGTRQGLRPCLAWVPALSQALRG